MDSTLRTSTPITLPFDPCLPRAASWQVDPWSGLSTRPEAAQPQRKSEKIVRKNAATRKQSSIPGCRRPFYLDDLWT
jgi:hypothetical protein